jgi:hypothetical protein
MKLGFSLDRFCKREPRSERNQKGEIQTPGVDSELAGMLHSLYPDRGSVHALLYGRKNVAAETGGISLDAPEKKDTRLQRRKQFPHILSTEARNIGDGEIKTEVINTSKG